MLTQFIRRRKEAPFPALFWLFSAFIVSCGTTHLLEAVIFYVPLYRLAGVGKAVTAVVSWATLIALIPVVPKALTMRTPHQLEREVGERTAELARLNADLRREADDRAKAERALAEERERYRLTLESLGEGVLATGHDGRVTYINRVACSLIGWTKADATGRPIGEVFCAFDEDTSAPLESPSSVVQREGKAVALRDDYILADRGGHRRPIEICATPMSSGGAGGAVMAFRDVTERHQAQAGLARLAAIVGSSEDAIVGENLAGIITNWNEAAERLLGYTENEVVGKPISLLIPPELRDEMATILGRIRNGERIEHFETERLRKDGERVAVSLSVSPVRDAHGRIVGAAKIARDVTERKKAEAQLRRTTTELSRSNRELEQFAYVASHDLQEPLRSISGCLDILRRRYEGRLDARADELITHVVGGARRMKGLIEDLLAYSRVGTRGAEFAECDCGAALRQAICNLEALRSETDTRITHDGLPTVRADLGQVTQLFQNLLGNAIKYRGRETPVVHVGARREGAAWELTVKDNGIGIEPQYFDRIFVIFQRLHTTAEYPGTGIGLAISKKIVERRGGCIWVTSAPGVGSTFHFTIPDRVES